jgi:eukaryotic translation initiation factor 2C
MRLTGSFFRGADSTGNCPAGFMAERGIQSPTARDFYLQSHGGLKGSELFAAVSGWYCVHQRCFAASRPAHYTVLRDDNFNAIPHVYAFHLYLCLGIL